MVHQPSGGFQGQVTDIEIQTNEIIKTKKRLNEIYTKHTNKSIKEIESIMERDRYFSPEEAIKLVADLLVIGRPITESKNPLKTIKKINKSIN